MGKKYVDTSGKPFFLSIPRQREEEGTNVRGKFLSSFRATPSHFLSPGFL